MRLPKLLPLPQITGAFGFPLCGCDSSQSLTYGIELIRGNGLLPAVPLTKTSAYCYPSFVILQNIFT